MSREDIFRLPPPSDAAGGSPSSLDMFVSSDCNKREFEDKEEKPNPEFGKLAERKRDGFKEGQDCLHSV